MAADASSAMGANPAGTRRGSLVGLVGIGAALILLPVTAMALWPAWAIVHLVVPLPYWAFFVVYLAAGVALFTRSIQRHVLGRLLRLRELTQAEWELLQPRWNGVLGRVGASPQQFVLRMQDFTGYDASMVPGGHVVDISTGALEVLEPDELEAMLAQKICHHRGLHSVGDLVAVWLTLPITLVAGLGFLLEQIVVRIGYITSQGSSDGSAAVALALLPVALLLRFLVFLAKAVVWGAGQLSDLILRRSVYAADRDAAALGYGQQLVAALEQVDDTEPDGGKQRMFAGFPPIAARINRIQRYMSRVSA